MHMEYNSRLSYLVNNVTIFALLYSKQLKVVSAHRLSYRFYTILKACP